MYMTVEKPGVGTYMCITCFLELIIENDNEELPECGKAFFKKVD